MTGRTLALTCMKNEGPFILEWVAYHISIGIDHFLVYTNDCEDGTDAIWQRLAQMGLATHRDNPASEKARSSHQIRAFRKARGEDIYKGSEWATVIDVDEFINVHVGNKSLQSLINAAPNSDCISLTWRLFGCSDRSSYHDSFLTESLRRAAPHHCPKPFEAWGMKSIYKTDAIDIIGCHRPKSVHGAWQDLNWVNGAGEPMPEEFFNGGWRFSKKTARYDLAQINHYAVRTRESFLVKHLRGRAHHDDPVDAAYWTRMNRNEEVDTTILAALPAAHDIFDELLEDPILGDLHGEAVEWHQASIEAMRATPEGQALFLSLMPDLFGRAA